jgi:hypothetical protein
MVLLLDEEFVTVVPRALGNYLMNSLTAHLEETLATWVKSDVCCAFLHVPLLQFPCVPASSV